MSDRSHYRFKDIRLSGINDTVKTGILLITVIGWRNKNIGQVVSRLKNVVGFYPSTSFLS